MAVLAVAVGAMATVTVAAAMSATMSTYLQHLALTGVADLAIWQCWQGRGLDGGGRWRQ